MDTQNMSRANHPSTRFHVSDAQVIQQVADATATTDGDHLVVLDPTLQFSVITTTGPCSFASALHYLDTGEWVDDPETCDEPDCLRAPHAAAAAPPVVSDDELLDLVHKDHASGMSLAELYRRGRARGLISPRKEYHNT